MWFRLFGLLDRLGRVWLWFGFSVEDFGCATKHVLLVFHILLSVEFFKVVERPLKLGSWLTNLNFDVLIG